MRAIKSAKIARKYQSGVDFQQAYIDIILRLAGYRLSDMYTSILAYVSYYGKLDKNVKQILAEKNRVNQKLIPADKEAINLTLMLGVEIAETNV